jgi:transglutaminase-like putative cysteine protease
MTSYRRTLAAALATAAASVSLYPIFIGVLWFWAGLGSIVIVAAVSTATRLRPLPVPVCLVAGAAALLLYLNLAFSNARSLYHLLPTPTSVRLLFDLAGQGFDQASKYAPPVPGLHGMVLLAAAGIGITALLADLIAVRLSSAALAGLPLLLLFTEPFTLSVSRGFFGTTVAFCIGVAGYLALLSSEGRDRIREWERPQPSAGDTPDTRTLAAAGRRVGFASVVFALCLPLVVPGLHVTRLFGGQQGIGGAPGDGGGSAGVGFPDPNTRLSQELKMTQAAPVLIYTTKAATPGYLQVYVLDRLTDDGWRIFGQPESLAPVGPRLPPPPGLTSATSVTSVTTSVELNPNVGADELGALPVPYPAATVSVSGAARADRATLMVLDPTVALGGLKYSVTSLSESPSQQQLNATPSPPPGITEHYLTVPAAYNSLPAIFAVARSVVGKAGAKTPFEEAVALQNWLSGGAFRYTLNAPTVLDARGLERFLIDTKAGYCQQFSFAMAVLARLLGIPSRVAYGFTSGTSIGDNAWLVTTHDAHAWPELYFQGAGWLRFEPTPSGGNGQGTATPPSYTLALGNASVGAAGQSTPTAGPSTSAGGGLSPEALQRKIQAEFGITPADVGAGQGGGRAANGGTTAGPWEVLGLVVAGLLAVAVAAPWCTRLAVRRRRWRRADDVALAHAAWRELRDDLVDHSAGGLPSESPRAVAARAGTSLALAEPARAALGRIAMAEERARYAPRPADGSGLRHDSTTVRRAIAAAVPGRTRWRARLAPASVLGRALSAITAAGDTYRGVRGSVAGRIRAGLPSRYPRSGGHSPGR